MEENIMEPIFQYGFAGMCTILLGIIVWLIKVLTKTMEGQSTRLVDLQKKTNQVIDRNSSAIDKLTQVVHDKL